MDVDRKDLSFRSFQHVGGGADSSPFDQNVVADLVSFLSASFDQEFTATDSGELANRLNLAVGYDRNWRPEYSALSVLLNELSDQRAKRPFSSASRVDRQRIVADLLSTEGSWRRRKLLIMLGLDSYEVARAQRSTIPHLLRLYRLSGVPWRERGYDSWPGVGGEPFAYTRGIEPPQC